MKAIVTLFFVKDLKYTKATTPFLAISVSMPTLQNRTGWSKSICVQFL